MGCVSFSCLGEYFLWYSSLFKPSMIQILKNLSRQISIYVKNPSIMVLVERVNPDDESRFKKWKNK